MHSRWTSARASSSRFKKHNMHTVIDDRMPKDLNDVTTFFTKVKALQPDVLQISGHEKGAATAARQMGEFKTAVPLIASRTVNRQKLSTTSRKSQKESSVRRSGMKP